MFLFFSDNWWSQVCPRYFLRLVDLYKGAVVYLLSGRKTLLIPVLFSSYITAALRLLEKLHKVSLGVCVGSRWFSLVCSLPAGEQRWCVRCLFVHWNSTTVRMWLVILNSVYWKVAQLWLKRWEKLTVNVGAEPQDSMHCCDTNGLLHFCSHCICALSSAWGERRAKIKRSFSIF